MKSVLKNILNESKLEETLVANWTHFLDSSRLLAYVLQNVQANVNSLAIITAGDIKPKGVRITLSRFYRVKDGFILWVEFTAPVPGNRMAEGTMELYLSYNGSISYVSMLGNIYSKN